MVESVSQLSATGIAGTFLEGSIVEEIKIFAVVRDVLRNDLSILQSHWSLPLFGDRPKKFDFVYQTVSCWVGAHVTRQTGYFHFSVFMAQLSIFTAGQ